MASLISIPAMLGISVAPTLLYHNRQKIRFPERTTGQRWLRTVGVSFGMMGALFLVNVAMFALHQNRIL